MRILTFKYGEIKNPGGINKVILKINSELSKKGHECVVITTSSSGFPNEEIYEGFKIVRVKSRLGSHCYGLSGSVYLYFKKYLNDLNPDVIHVHGYHGLSSPEVIFIINRFTKKKIPIVFSPHLDTIRSTFAGKYLWTPYNSLVGEKLFKYVNPIIAGSKFEATNIHQISNANFDKISIIPLGVNTIEYNVPSKVNKKINLVYAGYLIKRKGVHFILEGLHSLVYEVGMTNVLLTIIGEGPEKDHLLKMVHKLKLGDYIIWKDFLPIEELVLNIKDANIFLLLSESEAFGITVAEALALGTPCIVTNTTALQEFASEPGCFVVDFPPNPKEVADLILKIYETNTKVGPFSDKIRMWDQVAQDYLCVYSNVVNLTKE